MKLSEELQRKVDNRDILKTYEIEELITKVKELENLFKESQKDHLLTLKELKEAELEISALHKTIQSLLEGKRD